LKPYLLILLFIPALLSAEPMYSPTWGFSLDLPEGYEYTDGNGSDRFSFQSPTGAAVDIAVYLSVYQNVTELSHDIERRLGNKGDIAFFEYGDKTAALMKLDFLDYVGWALCLELDVATDGAPVLLAALAYAPANAAGMDVFHLSALDSFAPAETDRRRPGPITEFTWPRGQVQEAPIAGTDLKTLVRQYDAEAAQALIEREFALMRRYESSPNWQEAWIRYYRAIYRDSYDRIADAAVRLEQKWNDGDKRAFAVRALNWVQNFTYERGDFSGSDFVNLVSAVIEGRGDCDSRAMLWAMILHRGDVPAAMMLSRAYSHAMGLADIAGEGARFEAGGVQWLVAETTDKVDIGLIREDVSNTDLWLGVLFE
jgi:hypothetical protein